MGLFRVTCPERVETRPAAPSAVTSVESCGTDCASCTRLGCAATAFLVEARSFLADHAAAASVSSARRALGMSTVSTTCTTPLDVSTLAWMTVELPLTSTLPPATTKTSGEPSSVKASSKFLISSA